MDDNFHGDGEETFANGDYYKGKYANGKRLGKTQNEIIAANAAEQERIRLGLAAAERRAREAAEEAENARNEVSVPG